MLPVPVKAFYAVMLTLLALNLTACANRLPMPPDDLPPLPPPPSLSTPLPQTSYSLSAVEAIKHWRARLMGTSLMSSPATKPGP